MQKTISVVVPVHNEEQNVPLIASAIRGVFGVLPQYGYELIFVNDGSTDASQRAIDALVAAHPSVRSLEFSRNFGKEAATSAGLREARGDAVVLIDADMQHPPDLIPQFIAKWEQGAEMVIGVRESNVGAGIVRNTLSRLFYALFNAMSETSLIPGATDFRLIDRRVVDEFNVLTERNRITRGLLDWLGFRRETISFAAKPRANGVASYSLLKLIKLTLSSFVSHSLFPLRFAGYLGIFISLLSGLFGLVVFVNRYLFNDYLNWQVSGSAQLAILNVFFTGIILICLGLIALYVGNINGEVSGRPLYVVRKRQNFN